MPPPAEIVQVVRRVAPDDTARALGSGDLEVLGTPRLLAWCEQATVAAATAVLPEGRTSVGTRVELAHERASAVGTEVTVRAELVHVDGRLLRFEVVAEQDAAGARAVVARGTVTRVAVDPERFMARVGTSP